MNTNTKINFRPLILVSIFASLLIVGSFFVSNHTAQAAVRTWDGGGTDGTCGGGAGDGNKWSCAANWSADTVPTSGDSVVFDGTSTKDSTIDSGYGNSPRGIQINSGYTGTITLGIDFTLGQAGFGTATGFSQASGTFNSSNKAFNISDSSFSLSGGTFTASSATMSIERDFTISGGTFNHNSGTLNFNANGFLENSTLACNNTTLNAVQFNKPAFSSNTVITIGSDCSIPLGASPSSIGTFTNHGTMTVSSGTWSIRGGYGQDSGAALSATGLSLSTNFTITGGTVTSGINLTLTSFGSGDDSPLACNNITFGTVTISKNTGTNTVTVGSDCTLPVGNDAISRTTSLVNNGTITAGTGSWEVRGSYTHNSGATLTLGGSAMRLTGDLNINSSGGFPPGITLTLVSISSGETSTLSCSNVSFTQLVINKATGGNHTVNIGSDCSFPLGNSPTSTVGGGTINNNGTLTTGTGTWTVTGSYTQNSGASLTMSGTTWDINDGNLTLNGGSLSASSLTNLNLERNLTDSANLVPAGLALTLDGADDADDSTMTCGSVSYASITINKTHASGNTTLGGNCTMTGNFTRTDGPLTNSGSARTFFIGGNLVINTTDAFGGSNLSIELNGTGAQSISNNGPATFSSPLRISKSSGTASLATNLTVASAACTVVEGVFDLAGRTFVCATGFTVEDGGTLQLIGTETPTTPTLSSGSTVSFRGDGDALADTYTITTLTTNYYHLTINSTDGATDTFQLGAAVDINGNFTLTAGTFNVTAGNHQMNVAGNWSKTGTFNAAGGTVVFDGTSQTIAGSTTFNNFTKNVTSDDTLTFTAGTTQTINGIWTLSGQSGDLLSLRSSDTPNQWNVSPLGTRTLSFLDVQDSNNVSGSVITTLGSNITDSGNNTGWEFNDDPVVSNLGPASLTDGSWGNSNTPTFTLDLSDADLADTVQFQIQIDDSSNFSSPVVDYTSALQAQGPASFTVGQVAGSGAYAVGTPGQTLSDSSGYYWRVRAIDVNSALSSYVMANAGAIAFKIDTVAPTAGTLSLGSITSSSITASVAGASDILSGLAALPYNFSNLTASTSSGDQLATSWVSNGLNPNVSYTFQATVSDVAGNSATTNTDSAFTAANPPASLNLVVDSGTQITANWSVNSNPAGTEFFAENVTEGTDSGWVANATSWISSSLDPGVEYTFTVKARNGDGLETSTITADATTSGGAGGASSLGPAAYVNGSWGNNNTPTLTYSLADPDVGDQVGYRIQIDDTAGFVSPIIDYTSALGGQGSASFTVGQLVGGGSYTTGTAGQTLPDSSAYYWRVQAIDEHGDTSSFTEANSGGIAFRIDTAAPTAGTLSFSGITSSAITANVSGSGDALSGLATTPYTFTNTTTAQTSGAQSSTSWNNTGLVASTLYNYQLSVSDVAGNTATTTGSATTTAAGGGGGGGGGGSSGGGSTPPSKCESSTQQANAIFHAAMEAAKAQYEAVMQPALRQRQLGQITNKQYQDLHAYESQKWNDAKEAARLARKTALEQVCNPIPEEPPIPIPTPTPLPPVNRAPIGYLDGINSVFKYVFGWSEDPDNTFSPNYVHLYFDRNAGTAGAVPVLCFANEFRSDVGSHAFDCPVPTSLQDGRSHQVWAWGIDLTDPASNNAQLLSSPKVFTLGTVVEPVPQPTTPPTPTPEPITPPPGPTPEPLPQPRPEPSPVTPPTTPPSAPPTTPPTTPPGSGDGGGSGGSATTTPPGQQPGSGDGSANEDTNLDQSSGESVVRSITTSGRKIASAATEFASSITTLAKNMAQQARAALPVSPETIATINKVAAVTVLPAVTFVNYASALTLTSGGIALSELGLVFYRWLLGLLTLVGLRKKRRYWGTVYDSVTKQPLDPVIVSLVDVATGRTVEQAITDLMGRYGFLVLAGTYIIKVEKTHYAFPSKESAGNSDEIFDNLYHGQPITIASPSDVVSPNIPMDPLAFDWNQQDKQRIVKFHPVRDRVGHLVANVVFLVGFVIAVLVGAANPHGTNLIILAAYGLVMLVRLVHPPQRLWGRLILKPGNLPIPEAQIRATLPGLNDVVMGRAKTGPDGKFFLKVPRPGQYQLSISQGYTNGLLWKGSVELGKDGLLNKDIILGQ